MGDSNGRLESPLSNHATDSISPPSLKEGRCEKSDIFRSNTSSPLLDTETLPLDDETHCPYCHKGFRKPRVLDCLHSICEDCIIAQLDGRREAQKAQELAQRDPTDCELEAPKISERPTPPGVIRCPICLQESHVGNDVRYVYTMLLDYARLCEHEEASGEKRCRTCKNDQLAIAFCKQCQADLCSNCLTAHSSMRMFDGHEALTYDVLDKNGEKVDVRPVLCPSHHMPFKVLCATCETLACKNCLEIEHVNHKVIDVNDRVVSTIKNEIKVLSERVDNKWSDSMSEWSAIPDRAASLEEQYERAKNRLEQTFDNIIRAVEDAKIKKMSELEDGRHQQEQAIEELYRKMNLNEARVNDALSFTRRLLEKANGMELLASRRKVVQQLNNLSHTMPALGIQVELEFQPMPTKQMEGQIAQICGGIVSRMVAATHPKQPAPATEYQRTSQEATGDWQRGSTNGQTVVSNPALGAIGTERKKTVRSTSEIYGGWPPSSNPPDLGVPSPPLSAHGLPARDAFRNPPRNMLVNPAVAAAAALNTQMSIYNNYQWPPSSNPPIAAAMDLRQKLAAQMLEQGPTALTNSLMHARLHGIPDPVLALGGLTLNGVPPDGPGVGQRTSPQEMSGGRVSELKIHSVFGTSNQGSSMRELHCPSGFCLSETDDILIADTNNHRVVVCGPPFPWKIGRPGTDDGLLCFPRKVVALKGDVPRYVVLDKGSDGKTRAQIFDSRGEFVKRINLAALVSRGGIDVSAATCAANGHLVLVDSSGVVFCIDVDASRVIFFFDASSHLGEASDVAVYEKNVYITDFKHHCVQVFDIDGKFVRKLGEPSQTPYPIGIDISKKGEVLVADTHGNHLHVVVFNSDGQVVQAFTHNEFRLSRCVGLRVAGSGHIVTLCKHNHTLFVFKPLYIR